MRRISALEDALDDFAFTLAHATALQTAEVTVPERHDVDESIHEKVVAKRRTLARAETARTLDHLGAGLFSF
jgi:hypothetical protein